MTLYFIGDGPGGEDGPPDDGQIGEPDGDEGPPDDSQIGGPDGQQKFEIFNVDYKIGKCTTAAPSSIQSSLYTSSLEAMFTMYVIPSIDAKIYLDFEDMSDVSVEIEREEIDLEMSTPMVLASWGFLGAIAGLVSYFLYGFYVRFSGNDIFGVDDNKKIIQEAKREHEMSCKCVFLDFCAQCMLLM